MEFSEMKRGRLFLALGALVLLFPGVAGAQTAAVTQPSKPAVACPIAAPDTPAPNRKPSNALPYRAFPAVWQEKLDQLSAADVIPGAVIIVKSPVWGVRVGTTGYANIPEKVKPSPGQQFRIGSVSKMILAQAFLQLEQEGRIRLSDPVTKYLGEEPTVAAIPYIDRITIANLLQMTSGIAAYNMNPAITNSPYTTPTKAFTPTDLMAALGPTATPVLPPDYLPGATYPNPYWASVGQSSGPEPKPYPYWYYTNSNYILLGMIAEKVTKTTAADFIRQYVTDKIGLNDTFLAETEKQLPYMHGYTRLNAQQSEKVHDTWCDVTALNPSYAWTAGAMISTPWDLLHFTETAFKTEKLLNAGTKRKWLSFVSADLHYGWEPMGYGVGAVMHVHRPYGDGRGHGGAFHGYKTLVYHFFDSDTSFVLASNTWDGQAEVTLLDSLMPLVVSEVTTPIPASSGTVALGDNNSIGLSWQAGRVDAASYNVYIGTDADAVDAASPESHDGVRLQNVRQNNAVLTEAQPDVTYYWRVDIIGRGGIVPGALWRFRTVARN